MCHVSLLFVFLLLPVQAYANLTLTADQTTISVGDTVNFELIGQNCDPSHQSWRELWDFGDGTLDQTTSTDSVCARSPIVDSHTFTAPGTYIVEVESRYCRNRSNFDNCPPGQNRIHGTAQVEIQVLADEDVILSANGDPDSVTVSLGEDVDFEAEVFNCGGMNPDAWRERWIFDDGEDQTDGPFSDNPCDFSPLTTTHAYTQAGQFEAVFISEFCETFDSSGCVSGWEEHGRDTVIVIVELDLDVLIDYRMESISWDGSAGEVEDFSGNAHHATTFDGPQANDDDPVRDADPGTCRYAEIPAGGRISAPAPAELSTPNQFSVAFWFRAQSVANEDSVLALGDLDGVYATPMEILRRSNGNLRVVFTNQNGGTSFLDHTAAAFSGNWTHLAVTRELLPAPGVNQRIVERLYLNGNLVRENDFTTANPPDMATADNIHIGGLPGLFSGAADFDDVIFAEGALSQDDVNTLRLRDLPCDDDILDHIRILHPANGLTCSPSDITVQACADPDCDAFYEDPVDLTFTSPSGNWSQNPINFQETATVSLQVTSAGTAALAAVADDPEAENPNQCFTGGSSSNCEMEIHSAGFVIDVPDHVAGEVVDGTVAAVREDDETQQCVPGFDNESRQVDFSFSYDNPDSGTLAPFINNTELNAAITLNFDGDGVAPIELEYADVGRVGLDAQYQGDDLDDGLVMVGATDFIARPAGFRLSAIGEITVDEDNPGAEDANGPVFAVAGTPFQVQVSALNVNDQVTPNFGQESPAESVNLGHSLIQPVGGEDGVLGGSFTSFGEDCDGNSASGTACGEFSWNEVGIIELEPSLASGSYLGMDPDGDVQGSNLENVGRFRPSHYSVEDTDDPPLFSAGCSAGEFNYLTESMTFSQTLDLTITALNTDGDITRNADGDWWKLDDMDDDHTPDSGDFRYHDCRIANNPDYNDCSDLASGDEIDALEVDPNALGVEINISDELQEGVARLKLDESSFFGHRWVSGEGAPEVAPFTADFRTRIQIEDADDVNLDPAGNDAWYERSLPVQGDARQRHGRLHIANAHGSELLDLAGTVVVQYYFHDEDEGINYWKVNDDDECSTGVDLNVQAGTTLIESGDGCGSPSADKVWNDPAEGGDFNAWFTCADPGSYAVGVNNMPEWLKFDWSGDGDAHDQEPSGTLTFGIYSGPDHRIDLRETW